jgi:predicted lipoprotein with Yx(FWY)xxD motif
MRSSHERYYVRWVGMDCARFAQSLAAVRAYLSVPAIRRCASIRRALIVTEVPVKLTSSRTALAVASVFLLGVAASACGDDDDAASDTTTAAVVTTPAATEAPAAATTPATTPAAGTTTGSEAPAGASTVETSTTDLGTFLVDSAGMTLYVFVPDDAGPSTCSGDCLAAWPTLAGPATAGEGVDASLLGTAPATDGTEQATYNGWPLYYFAQDEAPGDVNGQGVGDKWYVVDTSGAMIEGT